MYIKALERKYTAIAEAKIVQKSDGTLHLWDTSIQENQTFTLYLEASLPDGEEIYAGTE